MFVRKGEDAGRKRLERGIETLKWQKSLNAEDAADLADYDRRIRDAQDRLRRGQY